MPLGTEVGLGPRDIVRWESSNPTERETATPTFTVCGNRGPCLLWPNGWMEQDATGTEVALGPGHIVLDGNSHCIR